VPLDIDSVLGRRVRITGHFAGVVRIEAVDDLDGAYEIRVRTEDGRLDETFLEASEIENGAIEPVGERTQLASGDDLFDLVEARRIELAFTHDPNFAVSLSGIRGLPHQITAVYRHMLPQARLRFVLADDPGAGKTIMAGLLMKELHLRGVADRVLILCPAPLTVQWQDELLDKFDEHFEVLDSHKVRWQLGGNAWQQTDRAIASLDFAKRDEILPDLLLADWDLVVIDEAHKCAAASYFDADEQRDKMDRTKRYALAEELSRRSERLLLMTATPHSGDKERFQNFLKLLDPDQFADGDLAVEQIGRADSPYFLRRQKEDLRDEEGAKLFVERSVHVQPFTLSRLEYRLYEDVSEYIQEFLGQASGRRGNAVALARTVMQRRLASSLGAIHSSLRKRAERIEAKIREVEALPPSQRAAKLAELRLIEGFDSEQDLDDADDEQETVALEGVVVAETLDQLRVEVVRLKELVVQAQQAIDAGEEAKLTALRECLQGAELAEIQDGRGKLLIFTEHRDTLVYLEEHLKRWGYTTCSIHGGVPPMERKAIQQDFHQSKQICVATEAAGEGINLQFCHLMINYDLPWNPVRLEQRMGRIHRIGQEKTCVIVNFCATNTIEGQLLLRLLQKLEEMREALGGRVYDVIGEVLDRNDLDFERLVRDTLLNPTIRDRANEQIEALTAEELLAYERDVGVAQAVRNIDVSWVKERDWRSEERRLMPEFVEHFFSRACARLGVRLERRADGLWRIEHVPATLRAERLHAVKRLGRPQQTYRKLTLHKEDRLRAEHEDAVLLSPGHSLFAATSEVLSEKLALVEGAAAPFVAPWAVDSYAIHFFTQRINGLSLKGGTEEVHAELVAVSKEGDTWSLVPPDVLHDLTAVEFSEITAPEPEDVKAATTFVRKHVQLTAAARIRAERLAQAELRSRYLEESLDVQQERLETKWSELEDRVYRGEESAALARDTAQRRLDELRRRREEKLSAFEQLGVVKPGPVAYVGTALVGPPVAVDERERDAMRNDPEIERLAMQWAMEQERADGWEPEDVSAAHDGSGFDIRSVRRDETGRIAEVRRIEVKGRSASRGDVALCRTEWIAAQRHGQGYWLYVLYSAAGDQRGLKINDPYAALRDDVAKVTTVTSYRIPGTAIERAAA
jgi:superfamily II DNA or RNA helicase